MEQGPTKRALRAQLLAARGRLTVAARAAVAERLRDVVLGLPELTEPSAERTVAAYASFGTEPGTGPLRAALAASGVRVLLPVLRDDDDLDWALDRGPDRSAPGRRGPSEPTGERLGADALTAVDLVVVPALAVDREGHRLGRGGGSYDRALARVSAGTPVLALLYDGELLSELPAEPHDRRVGLVAMPSGVVRIANGPRRLS